jgi:HAD superfamily hydrolase (TIGR01549 family)
MALGQLSRHGSNWASALGDPESSAATGGGRGMTAGVLLDVDGTLVDSNYHHTLAWARAFSAEHITVPLAVIHRHNGMGGDRLVESVAGEDVERRVGDRIRDRESEEYGRLIGEVQPTAGARELLEGLHGLGHLLCLASSAKPEEVAAYVELLDAGGLFEAMVCSADVSTTKPHPELVEVARDRLEGADTYVFIGDSTWDCTAAAAAGVPTIAVLTGGFGRDELEQAGAAGIFADPRELVAHIHTVAAVALSAAA